ncbi:VOC family protein [Streptomyces sp. NPDC051211]|uniref:VOC family protein n=1 Tax=Streptomyces sp. NPDC051211 TaxID=3154643 RepID=UPI00344ED7F8
MTVAKTTVLVLDCAEPERLAHFYAALLGAETGPADGDPDLVLVNGGGTLLGIRRDRGHAPASWPRPEDSQQAHLRILVAPGDLDEAEREAVGLGARPVTATQEGEVALDDRTDLRRYTDPAGHPFVLVATPLP